MSDKVFHTLKPVFNNNSKILILGTIPSPKSRENGFYYGHPQNRFWIVLSSVLGSTVPQTNEEKINLLLNNNIAIWDVLSECNIKGAEDSSIVNPIPNDLNKVINNSSVKQIFTTGKKAYELYQKYCFEKTNLKAISLPSTSPANCTYSLDKLVSEYKLITEYLK